MISNFHFREAFFQHLALKVLEGRLQQRALRGPRPPLYVIILPFQHELLRLHDDVPLLVADSAVVDDLVEAASQ